MADLDLRRTLVRLIAVRAIISTALLGGAVYAQIRAPGIFPVDPFFFLIAFTYALTIGYGLTVRLAERFRWLIDLQLAGDALVISAFVYFTGGITSFFSFLYLLPIVAASALRFRLGGLVLATLSTAIYTGLVIAQYLALAGFFHDPWLALDPLRLPPVSVAQYTVALNVFGFFAVALLSGSLAENLRAAGARLALASNQIASLQAYNQHVIDSLPSGLVTTDTTQRILTFNHAAEHITGLGAASAVGRPVADVLQFPSHLAEMLDRGLAGGNARRLELRYRSPGGRDIEIGMSVAHLETPGGRAGFLIAFQDVTSIKKLERDARMQQRLAAVGEMAAGIAHEIRNPLASMSGSIQILRQELPLSSEQEQLMDIVMRESERLNATIRSFLAYARPQRFAIARFDVGRTLNDAALLLRNSAEVAEGHVIEVDAPGEVWLEADEGQIKQIVWNLATNGLRAMPDGGRLLLSATVEPGSEAVLISVRDQGIGIPADQVDRLFQPFHGSFAGGSGLGLAIVHRIVTDYGGEVRVSSEPGAGTAVSVSFPVRVGVAG
jgi:two-component system sensor histidine kinase PilS (NtrC family)